MKTIDTKSMLIGLLLASTIFFGMAAGDADDKKIEQLEKAIAAAETKEERDKLFTQLNALLEPQKPNKKPNAVPKPAKPNKEPNVAPKLAKGDDKREWDIGMVRVTHDGGFELTIWREQNLEAAKIARAKGQLEKLGKHVYNGWPPGWEPVTASTEGRERIWDVRKLIKKPLTILANKAMLDGEQEWETGRLVVRGSIGPFSALQNKKNRQFILFRDVNSDANIQFNKHEGAENSNSWPEGWEPLQILEVKRGISTTWSVRRRLEFRTENKFDDPTK